MAPMVPGMRLVGDQKLVSIAVRRWGSAGEKTNGQPVEVMVVSCCRGSTESDGHKGCSSECMNLRTAESCKKDSNIEVETQSIRNGRFGGIGGELLGGIVAFERHGSRYCVARGQMKADKQNDSEDTRPGHDQKEQTAKTDGEVLQRNPNNLEARCRRARRRLSLAE